MPRHPGDLTTAISWAKESAPPTWLKPHGKISRPQAEGLRFERLVAKAFPGFIHGQWFTYGPGLHWCQPDLIFKAISETVCLEVKLTDTPEAVAQLRALYMPILSKAYGLPVRGIIVAKYLTADTNRAFVTSDFHTALEIARAGGLPILHWGPRGRSPRTTTRRKGKPSGLARPV